MPEFSTTNQPTSEAKKRGWTFRQTMERILSQDEPKLGVNDRVPLHERIVRAHVAKALEGDMPAVKELYDRVDGKTAQNFELTGKEGGPIETKDLTDPSLVREAARRLASLLYTGANAST
jgi:hypothetical protein